MSPADPDPFDGFEPVVGAVRAIRTFRLRADGALLPLTDDDAWSDGTNTARCRVAGSGHPAPEPDCSCGLYAYATPQLAAREPQARLVLAVVSCWGRIIAGTKGLRAEFARIEAVHLDGRASDHLAAAISRRYPHAELHRDRSRLLEAHPPTTLTSYRAEPAAVPGWRRRLILILVAGGVAAGVWPHVLPVWAVLAGTGLLLAAASLAWRSRRAVQGSRYLLLATAAAGWLFLDVGPVPLSALGHLGVALVAGLGLAQVLGERRRGRQVLGAG
jgi:hypothetical protein